MPLRKSQSSVATTLPIGESDVTNLTTDLAAKTAKATLTTKGDLYAASAASTPARLAVGTNAKLLVADSSKTTGLNYVTLLTVQTGVPGASFVTPLVEDDTAVTGGLYAWNGSAYVKVAAGL